jgi:hypothetical protein
MIRWGLALVLLAAAFPTTTAAQSSSASYLTVYKDATNGQISSDDLAILQTCKDAFEAKRPPPADGSPPDLSFIQAEVTAINQCAEDARLQGVEVSASPGPIAPIVQLLH